jgi:hypothetical protein
MPVFAWRRQQTRHFGEQWVPFAEMHLKAESGRWYAFAAQVDTGAVVSVAPRSVADLLGLERSEGDAIELSGVDAPPRRYFLQTISTRIGEMDEFPMRIAIAEQENVPTLLGRLDVLSRYQIDFDTSLEETRIMHPWLDSEMRRVWKRLLETQKWIIERWSENPLPGRADEAARRLINRADHLVAAGAALLKLHREFELPLMIRSLWEVSVQFEYLMAVPVPRSELFLDFEHVTKYKTAQARVSTPGEVGDRVRASPLRAQGEARLLVEFQRVKSNYARTTGAGSLRTHWYPGTLRDLAAEVGREGEYKAVYALYSAWSHGDPWTAYLLELPHAGILHLFMYWARPIKLVADAKRIILSGDTYKTLEELAKGII